MWAATGPARIPARTRLDLILPPIPLRCATRRAAAKDSRAARCRPPNGSPARRVFTSSPRLYLPDRDVTNRAATVRERRQSRERKRAMYSLRWPELTDESVCPTLARFCGAGAFACQPILHGLARMRTAMGLSVPFFMADMSKHAPQADIG